MVYYENKKCMTYWQEEEKNHHHFFIDDENLKVTQWGTLKTDLNTMETNLPGVFAAGDIVRGSSLVVWAIKDGRDGAISIDNYLRAIQNQKVA